MKNESCHDELLDTAQVVGQSAGHRAALYGGCETPLNAPPEFDAVPELRRAWRSAYIAAFDACLEIRAHWAKCAAENRRGK